MSAGIVHEFFDAQDVQSKQRQEEERLIAHIAKAKSVKEAEMLSEPKCSPRNNVQSGPELMIEWVNSNGEMKNQMKMNVDHVFRLPLQTICEAWNIKNVRFFEGDIAIKPMFDGYSDLSIFDRSATTVKLLADPMTAEDQEEAKRKRRPSAGALPRRISSGNLGNNTIVRRPSMGTISLAPGNAAPAPVATTGTTRRPSIGGNDASAAISSGSGSVRRPSFGSSATISSGSGSTRRPSIGTVTTTLQPQQQPTLVRKPSFGSTITSPPQQPALARKTSFSTITSPPQQSQQPPRRLSNATGEVSTTSLGIQLSDEEKKKREKMEEDRLWAQISGKCKQ